MSNYQNGTMKLDKEKWMDDVFDSMKASQKAKPNPDLFAKIQQSIAVADDNIIPMHRFRFWAAAASLVLIVNITALMLYLNQNNSGRQASVEEEKDDNSFRESLISTFQIY